MGNVILTKTASNSKTALDKEKLTVDQFEETVVGLSEFAVILFATVWT